MDDLMTRKYYTVKEAAIVLKVSTHTILRWAEQKKMRGTKVGRKFLFPEAEINRVLGEPVPTAEELKEEDSAKRIRSAVQFSDVKWAVGHEDMLDRWRNPQKRVKWADMTIEDYYAYWFIIIKPKFEAKIGEMYSNSIAPSRRWLEKEGFRTFVRSFEEGYLQAHGIHTVREFFKKAVGLKVVEWQKEGKQPKIETGKDSKNYKITGK